jgi:hypothetical protein
VELTPTGTQALIVDKSYDSDWLIGGAIEQENMIAVIP